MWAGTPRGAPRGEHSAQGGAEHRGFDSSALPVLTIEAMSRFAKWLTVACLLWVLLPGTWELTENVVHLVQDGHLAHSESSAHPHGQPDPEHGCSGTLHFCSCHAPAPGIETARLPRRPLPLPELHLGRNEPPELQAGFPHSLDRPPRV